MAGGGRIPGLDSVSGYAGKLRDIGNAFDAISGKMDSFERRGVDIARSMGDASNQLDRLFASATKARAAGHDISGYTRKIDDLTKKIDNLGRTAQRQGYFQKISQGFDKMGKSLLALNIFSITGIFKGIISGIQRVYELQERWTRAIGEFNKKVGGASPHLREYRREAMRWEGTMRGLTDNFGEGLQMFAEFGVAFGKMNMQTREMRGWGKFGLQLARGFDLGGEAAGRLSRAFLNLGLSSSEATEVVGRQLVAGAKAADVSVNVLTKDVAESSTYMARFGKSGLTAFVTGAAYARKFGLAIKDLQKMSEVFDTFESGAEAAAKMNVTFGTAVNGIDMLLDQDPARRFEQIRKQLLGVGKTWDTLSYSERRMLTQTTQLNEEELASMLSQQNAGVSYADFKKKQQAEAKKEQSAQHTMQLQLRKTVQTMFAFGAAMDRITVAIANAIKPFLVMLGLSKYSKTKFTSFGQVMGGVTAKIEGFFNALAGNDDWNDFMKEMAGDAQGLASGIGDAMAPKNVARTLRSILPMVRDFYRLLRDAFKLMAMSMRMILPLAERLMPYMGTILKGWIAFKALQGANSVVSNVSKPVGALFGLSQDARGRQSEIAQRRAELMVPPGTDPALHDAYSRIHSDGGDGQVARRPGRFGRAAGRALGGIGIGAGVGAIMGGGTSGAVGGALGGALGSFLGPLGSIAGAAIGNGAARLISGIGSWLKRRSHSETELERAMKARRQAEEQLTNREKLFSAQKELAELGARNDREQMSLGRSTTRRLAKRGGGMLSGEQRRAAAALYGKMGSMGGAIGGSAGAKLSTASGFGMDALSGASPLTSKTSARLLEALDRYQKIIDKIARDSERYGAQLEKEMRAKMHEVEIKTEEMKVAKWKIMADISDAKLKEMEPKYSKARQALMINGVMHNLSKQQKMEYEAITRKYNEEKSMRDELKTRQEKSETELLKYKLKNIDIEQRYFMTEQLRNREDYKLFAASHKGGGDPLKDFVHSLMGGGKMGDGGLNLVEAYKLLDKGFADLTAPKATASGGIFSSPTNRLVGEAGPEAVIPLRAMARGRMPNPMGSGGEAARRLVNYAASGGGSSPAVVTRYVSGDVYLDGEKVGRHQVREALRARGM